MKKTLHFLLASFFIFISCQKDDEIFESAVKEDLDKDKIEICHKGKKTLRIDAHAVPAHLAHGDKLGPCSDDPEVNYTNVPDDNFEQALIDLGYDNVLDNLVLTSNISEITVLVVSGKNITDLTGIEDFTNLENLNCSSNQLTELDLSNNLNIKKLYCFVNKLESLNIKNGNNTNIVAFNSKLNRSLFCIEVDDASYSSLNWLNVDAWSEFNEDCI